MIRLNLLDELFSRCWRPALAGLMALTLLSGCAQVGSESRRLTWSQGVVPPIEPRLEDSTSAPSSVIDLQAAEAFYQQGRNAEAQAAFMKLLERYPRNAYFWFRLGNTYARTRDVKNAIEAFDNAVALDATDGRFHYNLALMHLIAARESLEGAASRLSAEQPLKAEAEATLRQLSEMLDGGGRAAEPVTTPAPVVAPVPAQRAAEPASSASSAP